MEPSDQHHPTQINHREMWSADSRCAFENWQRNLANKDGFTYSERSILQHCAMWHRFETYLATQRLTVMNVQSDHISRFLDVDVKSKDGKDAKGSTKRRYLSLLAATFERMSKVGARRGGNPCASLFKFYRPTPEDNPGAIASQQDETFVSMVLASGGTSWRDCRDRAMLVLIIGSGLYPGEVIRLNLADIFLDGKSPYISVGAHGRVLDRMAPIVEFARKPLREWLDMRATLGLPEDEQTVFISGKGGAMRPATLYRKVQAIFDTEGTTLRTHGGRGPQILRNSFLVRQLAKDKPVDVVQQWAGHVRRESTVRFRRLLPNPGGVEAE